jgi:hypothetical protein
VTNNAPVLITDEIRAHLANDPMVVVDLGSRAAPDDPNPNVMYELGIRHAFDKAVVIMANLGQVLPFDVSGQRAIVEARDLDDLEENRRQLEEAIRLAAEGKFYRPMEAVGRRAELTQIAAENPALGAIITELGEVKGMLARQAQERLLSSFYDRTARNSIVHNLARRPQLGTTGLVQDALLKIIEAQSAAAQKRTGETLDPTAAPPDPET